MYYIPGLQELHMGIKDIYLTKQLHTLTIVPMGQIKGDTPLFKEMDWRQTLRQQELKNQSFLSSQFPLWLLSAKINVTRFVQ